MEKPNTVGPVTKGATIGTTLSGALSIIIVWLLSMAGVDMPPEVASAVTVVIGAVGTVIGGWVVKPQGDHRA